nr:membrane magnesium transporter [Ipomoea batatas]
MGMSIGFLVGTFGVLILSHAAYSTIQYRALLKITEEEFSGPPINVVMELIIGLVLCIWAALIVPGKFLSIHPQSEENRWLYGVDNRVSIVAYGLHLFVPGKFLSIHPQSEENRVVALPANLDFMIFNHRGKAFPLEVDFKLK